MLEEYFEDYKLTAVPRKTFNGRWAVVVKISKVVNDSTKEEIFFADDKIWYILEIEAAKEAINLGKNLIRNNIVDF